jgi:hypothetical protein
LGAVDLTGYEPFDAGVRGPLRDATRADAERCFTRLMAARAARIDQLGALAARHGVAFEPAAVGAWLVRELGGVNAVASPPQRGREGPLWIDAIAVDAALWLGERIIAAAPAISWILLTAPKKSTGYQRAVLTGFARVDDPRYYVDVAHLVASWAELAARRRAVKPDFLATIEAVTLADAVR